MENIPNVADPSPHPFLAFEPSVRELLAEAVSFLSKGWTQKTFARDELGCAVAVNDPQVTCWCLAGGLVVAYNELRRRQLGPDTPWSCWSSVVTRADEELRQTILGLGEYGGGGIVAWNDAPGRTQGEVIAVLQQTIDRLKECITHSDREKEQTP